MKRKELERRIKDAIRHVSDYPKDGINFKDTTPMLRDRQLFKDIMDYVEERYCDRDIDYVVGKDMQPLLWVGAVASTLGAGVVPMFRKDLYGDKISREYEHEYRKRTLHLQKEALNSGDRVLLVDYIIATGKTMSTMIDMVDRLGADIEEALCILEIESLGGREKINDQNFHSIARFDE